jgi:hypothetical protein
MICAERCTRLRVCLEQLQALTHALQPLCGTRYVRLRARLQCTALPQQQEQRPGRPCIRLKCAGERACTRQNEHRPPIASAIPFTVNCTGPASRPPSASNAFPDNRAPGDAITSKRRCGRPPWATMGVTGSRVSLPLLCLEGECAAEDDAPHNSRISSMFSLPAADAAVALARAVRCTVKVSNRAYLRNMITKISTGSSLRCAGVPQWQRCCRAHVAARGEGYCCRHSGIGGGMRFREGSLSAMEEAL